MLKEFLSEQAFSAWKALQDRLPLDAESRLDQYGQDVFDLSLYGAQVLTTKAGIGGSTLLLMLLKPYVQKGLVSLEECGQLFSPKVQSLLETMQRLDSLRITDENLADKEFSSFWMSFVKRRILCSIWPG